MNSDRRRIRYLDGLRGIAALLVVLQHLAETIILAHPGAAPFLRPEFVDWFNSGRFGVALFFIISGFVVPFSFKEPRPIRTFAISRFFRLYPAYWVSLAIAVVTFPLLQGSVFSNARILANVTMVQAALGQRDINATYWTLFIEIIFYLLCVGLYASRRLSDWRALATAIVVCLSLSLALAIFGELRGHHLPANVPVNLALMFLGTLMRRGWLEGDAAAKRWIPVMAAIWAVPLPVIMWLTPGQADIPVTPIGFCVAYWMALAVFVLAAWRDLPKGRLFLALGAASYSLYLFHGVCIVAMRAVLTPSSLGSDVVFVVASLAFSIATAALVYRLVERPSIRAGHRLVKLLQGRPVETALPGPQTVASPVTSALNHG